LYGTTTQDNHVVFLVKLAQPLEGRARGMRDAQKDIAVAVKSNSPELALGLKEELARIDSAVSLK
jgi:hypothetical protein